MTATTDSLSARVASLLEYIQTGRILDAMTEFYAEHSTMQENSSAPTVGLEANIEREKQFLAQVKDFQAFDVLAVGVDEAAGTVLIESQMRFINTDDQPVVLEQVHAQRWSNGKIDSERFYYDASGK